MPVWTFSDGNIYQSTNSAPSVAVGNIWFSDVEFEGTLTVEHTKKEQGEDNDYVGVVFSFQVTKRDFSAVSIALLWFPYYTFLIVT